MALLRDARAALDPKFYKRFRKDRPLAPAYWRYYLPLYLLSGILGAIASWFFTPWLYAALGMGALITNFQSTFLLNVAASLISGALLIFPWAWFLAACLRVAGAKCSFRQAFHLEVYSYTPTLLLGWIPIINILAFLWTTLLWFQGGKQALRTSYGTILGGLLIAAVVIGALTLLVLLPVMLFAIASSLRG